jgi:hypothetical protein
MKYFFWVSVIITAYLWIDLYDISRNVNKNYTYFSSSPVPHEYLNTSDIKVLGYFTSQNIDKISLEEKYKKLTQEYYAVNIVQYLPIIDEVLVERDLDNNEKFIQGMFYIGQQESHWSTFRISRFNIKGGHPTGIFQFLPGTFRSVSKGDIFNARDQINAFVTMWERGRCDEFAVMFTCNYSPCLKKEVKDYMLYKS